MFFPFFFLIPDYTTKKTNSPNLNACRAKKSPEHSCKICKEKQKRALFSIIKARTQKTSITEEEETEEVTGTEKSDCAKLWTCDAEDVW